MAGNAARSLDLREWQTTPGVNLTAGEVRALRGAGAGLKILATGQTSHYDIEASSTVGTVVGPNMRAIIHPKLSIRRVLYLLTYLRDLPSFSESIALDEEDDDLLEIMLELFTKALDRALTRGLVREYREREEPQVALRGRLDLVALSTRRFGIFPPVDCRFSEFTADTEANRRLLAAASLLTRAGVCGRGMRRRRSRRSLARLHSLIGRFGEVTRVHYPANRLAPLKGERRLEPFGTALALAETVLRHGSVELRQGDVAALGFLVDMNQVYEHFVVSALRGELGLSLGHWVHHPRGLLLDDQGAFGLSPDALWRWPDKSPRLVVDVKYKQTTAGESADIYQMLAYCTALGLSEGVLIYAGVASPDVHEVSAAGVRVHVIALDPGGSVADLRVEVARVASYLHEVALSL